MKTHRLNFHFQPCASALLPRLVHIFCRLSKHPVHWNVIPQLTLVSPLAPRRLQGYSLKLAGLQILQRSPPCHKLLMDDAPPREGCGCLSPEARITDGQWVLPLNTRCPCLLILYQWLCKRCTPIIHTDEQAVYSISELQRGPLTLVALRGLCSECADELIQRGSSHNVILWPDVSRRSTSQEKHSW